MQVKPDRRTAATGQALENSKNVGHNGQRSRNSVDGIGGSKVPRYVRESPGSKA